MLPEEVMMSVTCQVTASLILSSWAFFNSACKMSLRGFGLVWLILNCESTTTGHKVTNDKLTDFDRNLVTVAHGKKV